MMKVPTLSILDLAPIAGGSTPAVALPKVLRSQREEMAGWTGLEPATFCVTGRRSNQLSYHPGLGRTFNFPSRLATVKR
jgi:hypothetical protein